MWDGCREEQYYCVTPARITKGKQQELDPYHTCARTLEEDTCVEECITIYGGNRAYDYLSSEHITGAPTEPLSFPASALACKKEEEPLFTPPVSFTGGKGGNVEGSEVAQWGPPQKHQWFEEDCENSQRSAVSCQTHPTTVMQLGDPGAPTKKARARGCVFGEEDELSATCTTWIPCHHQDMMHGNKSHHTQNKYNNSISFPYDSSVPSHITPLDEVGDSIDLAEHLSHLVVVASPTQKRLVFSNVLDDCGNTGRGDARVGGSRTTPCSGRGMQLLQRSKRFLEEVDSNRDAASACSLPGAMTPDVHRKCRRVDTGEDEKSNSNGSSTARLIGGSCGGVVH